MRIRDHKERGSIRAEEGGSQGLDYGKKAPGWGKEQSQQRTSTKNTVFPASGRGWILIYIVSSKSVQLGQTIIGPHY